MDIISFNEAATANGRIEKFIKNPDSNSGIVTVPKVIEAGESVTVPAGRVAVLPNVQVDGEIVVEAGGEIFIPAGATFDKVVETTGDQTIDGIKTFLESPIVPTPTTGVQAVNKDYADLKVALTQFTGANQSLAQNGYQKLPGGLIIQWGFAPITASGVPVTIFPITFSNACFSVVATPDPTINSIASPIVYGFTKTSFSLDAIDGSTGNAHWIAIGY